MKKIILGAFLASALCSNLIFIPIASADETEYFNCSEENLITPETEANTCIFIDTPYRDADFQQAQDRIY